LGNLLKRLLARHGGFLAVTAAALACFQFVLCAIVSSVDVPRILGELMKNVPPLMRTLIEQQIFGGLNSAGLLAFGWNHPIALALGAVAAISLAVRASAGEIESGAMELLLSQPISRGRYLSGQIVFAFSSLAGMSVLGAAGTFIGQKAFALDAVRPGTLLLLAANFFLLQCVWYGIILLFSVFGREAGRVAFLGFLLTLASYFLQVTGQLWVKAAFLLPFSVNNYYSPRDIIARHVIPVKSLAVLVGLAAAGLGAAAWRFHKADLP
jgi:ABC-2 type transport system permease protein